MFLTGSSPFKHQPQEMVKHTQKFVGQQPMNCLSVLDHFVGRVLKRLSSPLQYIPVFKQYRVHPFRTYTTFSEKLTFLTPMIHKHVSEVRNVCFLENFAYVLNE